MKTLSALASVGLDYRLSGSRLKATLLATAVLAILLATVAVPACADTFSGGIVVQGQTFDPYHPDAPPSYTTLYATGGIITLMLQKAWDQNSPDICTSIQNSLGKPNALGAGYSPYGITCSMGHASQMQIAAGAITDGIHLTFSIPGNKLAFTTTQPTVCGSDCDPRFSVAYDLSVGLDVHPSGTKITVNNVAAKIQNQKVSPLNLAATYIAFVVGQQFLNNLVGQVNYHGADLAKMVNNNLGNLNSSLGVLAQQNGYKHLALSLETNQISGVPPTSVLLQLSPDKFSIPQGSGKITGAIRWDSKAGSPASCSVIRIVARATSGFQQQSQLMPPQTTVGSVQMTTLMQNWSISECDYVITGLPYNIPLQIEATVNGLWYGLGANELKSARPDGWAGNVIVEIPSTQQAQLPMGSHSSNVNAPQLGQATAAIPASLSVTKGVPPSQAQPVLRSSFATRFQNNPHGNGTVSGIDFAIQFQLGPH